MKEHAFTNEAEVSEMLSTWINYPVVWSKIESPRRLAIPKSRTTLAELCKKSDM